MERARADAQPKVPRTLEEYAGTFGNEVYRHLFLSPNNQCIFRQYINGNPAVGEAIIFISPILENLLASAQEVHVDATFKCRPAHPETEQLLVIMAMYMDQAFPIAYILMTRKTESAYIEVLTSVKNTIGNIQASNIVTDYETALTNALRVVFPTANRQRCWFHMAQALEKNARDFGIRRNIYNNDTHLHKTLINMAKALALLPPNQVGEGFEVVKRVANQSPNQNIVQRFLNYFRVQWIERVGADTFSVYGRPRRTNNDQEVFHRILNENMGGHRPAIWQFTKKLISIDNVYTRKYNALLSRPVMRPHRRRYVQQDKNIRLATEKLNVGRISIAEFLEYTSHMVYNPERRQHGADDEDMNIVFNPYEEEEDAYDDQSDDERPENIVQQLIQRQQNIYQNITEIQENEEDFIGNNEEFVLPEDLDENYQIVANYEAERLAAERRNIPRVELDITGVVRRSPESCVICLSNRSTHACIPCGHQCLCEECASIMEGQICPLCNSATTSINRIFNIT